MKFTSIKTNNGKHITAESYLNLSLIHEVKKEIGLYSLKYGVEAIGNPLNLPFGYNKANLYLQVTNEDIYVSAIVEFIDDDEYVKYEDYCDCSAIEFNVLLSNHEKIKLLSYLLNNKN